MVLPLLMAIPFPARLLVMEIAAQEVMILQVPSRRKPVVISMAKYVWMEAAMGGSRVNDATIDYVIGSCDGKLACEGSEILKAVGSCSGSLACRDSGRDSEVTYLKNSCKGDNACINNNMGIVVDSCHDYGSCSVSNIKERMENSCQGYQACGELGNYAIIGQVIDSCHGQDSCYGGWLPSWFRDSGMIDIRPNIGDIVRSCLDDRACYDTFGEGGPIKGIEDSCHGFESCTGIAAYDPTLGTRGNVGVVKNSCIGNQSCKDFGRGGGEQCVGDITYSCRSDNSCQGAFNNVHTTGPLTDCCNKPTVCAGVTSQPEECFSPSENLSCIPLEKVGNNGNPSGIFPLGPCQGDCDNDNECEGALVCFTRSVEEGNIGASVPGCSGNGGDASDDDDDFCTARPSSTYLAYIANGGVNQGAFPLKECEGDCDDDSECEGDLICFIRNQDTPEGGGLALVGGCQGLGVKGKDYCKRADA
eukprot:CAMPEP_0183748818 /NCGR_PEP_ID=MMETSP0737-20130205/67967_1 /TAXON_ID=385413 /ORGANISM="Thalassiosira miniscula, Strain CCMP1093" /LENGTH=473 /DNA_ID=CAMNT_0025984557 /DNA_START=468 /DNA_END=1888 /DNA_ORIENTATION=+